MIDGLSHITLIVKDLKKSADLFINLFGAGSVYESADAFHSVSEEVFLLVGGLWIALMRGDPLQSRTYNHIAFRIPDGEYDDYSNKVNSLGLATIDDRKRMPGEGRSIYFYDYDNHLFELHTGSLGDRLREYNAWKCGTA